MMLFALSDRVKAVATIGIYKNCNNCMFYDPISSAAIALGVNSRVRLKV
jgi:hypothetical protein|tara:strand:- start:290 stop:436 length:147 start_codon:yes stop_codon:yes gene_type:complete